MKKQLIAFIAAFSITAVVALAMLVIGAAALFNRNGVAATDTAGAPKSAAVTASQTAQVQQLQDLIAQYQAREVQYQQREQQYQDQLAQANTQTQMAQQQILQVQSLLFALQQRGLISVTADGRILINQ